MAGKFSEQLQNAWYDQSRWPYLLLPFSLLFLLISSLRRFFFASFGKPTPSSVPVIVVGNINVGGTGKTPLIISLANQLKKLGLKVGIISRGYGSHAPHYPFSVTSVSNVNESGDEALLIAKSTYCPLVISPKRVEALRVLLQDNMCDVVLSDDGLQHFALPRDFEIVVIDGSRGLGNGLILPAGPLRESASRLQTVDCIVINGQLKQSLNCSITKYGMQLKTQAWRRVIDDSEAELSELASIESVHAVTGIGNPRRFYRTLQEMNIDYQPHSFPDHHSFTIKDITFNDELPVVMTAKDAVKCQVLLKQNPMSEQSRRRYWYVPVVAQLPNELCQQIIQKLSLAQSSSSQTQTGTQV